jgi:hypothetical protein
MVPDVDVAFRQQTQHLGVLRGDDLPQRRRPQRCDRDRQRVVGIVLVRPPGAKHTDPRRECRRHVQDGLARSDQLLGEQVAKPAGGLDRPRSFPQRLGPAQQAGASSASLRSIATAVCLALCGLTPMITGMSSSQES